MLDPDYRKSPWNNSKYAPKNSGGRNNTITQTSAAIAGIVFVIIFFAGNLLLSNNIYRLMIAVFIALLFFGFIGRTLRKNEYSRLMKIQDSDQSIRQARKVRTVAPRQIELYKMSASEFEEFVADVINRTTAYRAEVTGGANDKGVDVKVYNGSELIGIVQCKRYTPDKPLSPGFIRELAAVKRQHRVRMAYLATTARFSEDSEREAEALGIKLLDGAKLKSIYERLNTVSDSVSRTT